MAPRDVLALQIEISGCGNLRSTHKQHVLRQVFLSVAQTNYRGVVFQDKLPMFLFFHCKNR